MSAEDALAADRERTLAGIASLTADLAAVQEATAGSNSDDEHDPEGSTIAFEREQLAALLARAVEHLDQLDAARQRLADGQYGRCLSCGRPIGDERLAALPTAEHCLACAAGARR